MFQTRMERKKKIEFLLPVESEDIALSMDPKFQVYKLGSFTGHQDKYKNF